MPTPDSNIILAPSKTTISIALEPAQNALNSLVFLYKAEHLSGLDEWVTRTVATLSSQRFHTHRLVFQGLFYAFSPTRSLPSFTAYLDDLAGQDPRALRDRLFAAYASMPPLTEPHATTKLPDLAPLLASRDAFIAYLRERFSAEHIDVQIETEAHVLLNDPPAMKELIVSHLGSMWNETLAAEWERVTPMLQACVDAFRQTDFSSRATLDAVRFVIGREPEEWWKLALEQVEQVIFVPSAHIGPYLYKFKANRVLWLIFGARLPPGAPIRAPDVSRAELLVRLLAMADDTRLRILQLVAELGELSSPDIMRRLELSQSAASRHLQQLSATGYLVERRQDGAKWYSLNPNRVEDTSQALTRLLRNKQPPD